MKNANLSVRSAGRLAPDWSRHQPSSESITSLNPSNVPLSVGGPVIVE
jgi:hypothetical protein